MKQLQFRAIYNKQYKKKIYYRMRSKSWIKNSFILLLVILGLWLVNSNKAQQQNNPQIPIQQLQFQRSHIVEVFPNISKIIQINKNQLQKYINENNQHKLMSNFLLKCKSIVRISQIYISVFTTNKHHNQNPAQVFDLNKNIQYQQSAIFILKFLSQFKFHQIQKIYINLRSSKFAVVSLTLLNNLISNQIDLNNKLTHKNKFTSIPVWIPSSYNPQQDRHTQIIKYIYFKPLQHPTKLKINRIKGHPKIFLFNCQTKSIDFCRQQIINQHIEGSLMFQKQIQVSIAKQKNCRQCIIILAFKNMGIQTELQINEHTSHQSMIISKDRSIFYNLKHNQSLQITSYFNYVHKNTQDNLFLDFSLIQGKAEQLTIEYIKVQKLNNQQSIKDLNSQYFAIDKRPNALRIRLNGSQNKINENNHNEQIDQIWYMIKVKILSRNHAYFTVVDQNIPSDQQNFISLKDGQIFHSYIFKQRDQGKNEDKQIRNKMIQKFKVKLSSISTLSITTYCNQFSQLQIQYYSNISKITKYHPKLHIQNITNHNKKCSQLIQLNPSQFTKQKQQNQQSKQSLQIHQKGIWVYIKLSGIQNQIDLLYSSNDIIMLQKEYPYHSQIQYNQDHYFYIPDLKSKTIIKITKCSDCHLILSFSEQQLVDMKSKRNSIVYQNQLQFLNNQFVYQPQSSFGLYIKLHTNNYAHFVLTLQQYNPIDSSNPIQQITQSSKNIQYSLEDKHLIIQFSTPSFKYVNNLNSPTYFTLIEGSINVQVAKQTYCPQFIFSHKQKTRDISITNIVPQLFYDQNGQQKMKYIMEVKHHDFFGIRAQKGSQIFSYKIVDVQSMKQFAQFRWTIFNVLLFLTFTLFMSFVCYMGLKRKRIRKIGGQVIEQYDDGQQTSMVRLN